jgi:chloramphenicol-sensitive protein RarD
VRRSEACAPGAGTRPESARTPGEAARPTGRERAKSHAGLLFALSAYAIWGFIPLYFHALSHVPPLVVLCHRVIWSAVFIAFIVSIRKEWRPVILVLTRRRNLLLLSAGAVFIALNWLIFIYAVVSRQLLQASLGYFINPLLSVALGMIFLRERLQRWQWLALFLAILAVANLALHSGGAAWISVSLAATFGSYGLVRKKLDINSLHGLLIESSLLLPLAVVLLALLPAPVQSPGTRGLLSLSGIITAVPLLCFGAAVRQLSLATMGFLQYLGPTLQFLVAVCLFAEPVDRAKLGSFVLCWLAIGVYVLDSILNRYPQEVADEPE